MPNKHKTPMVGWHPKPPGLAERIRSAAASRGLSLSAFLDRVLAEYLDKHDPQQPEEGEKP